MYYNASKIYDYEKTNMGWTTYFTENDLIEMKMRYYDSVRDNTSFTFERDLMNTMDPFNEEFFKSKEDFETKVNDGSIWR